MQNLKQKFQFYQVRFKPGGADRERYPDEGFNSIKYDLNFPVNFKCFHFFKFQFYQVRFKHWITLEYHRFGYVSILSSTI